MEGLNLTSHCMLNGVYTMTPAHLFFTHHEWVVQIVEFIFVFKRGNFCKEKKCEEFSSERVECFSKIVLETIFLVNMGSWLKDQFSFNYLE